MQVDIEAATRRFDADTSKREFAMKLGGFPQSEITEFVASREAERERLIQEARSEIFGPQCC